MNKDTEYSYKKRIKQLEDVLSRTQDDLYNYRMTVLEIFDGIVEVTKDKGTSISVSWILNRLRKCLK